MKTIYNTYVEMESQEQCDRMKKACVENGLPIWEYENAFIIWKKAHNFSFSKAHGFAVYGGGGLFAKVTESEWLELLKTTK